jgi:hypothetical protein
MGTEARENSLSSWSVRNTDMKLNSVSYRLIESDYIETSIADMFKK